MGDLREAAQQALYWWDGFREQDLSMQELAQRETLRAALEQPEPPWEAQTDAEKLAYCAGWWAAMEAKAKEQPVGTGRPSTPTHPRREWVGLTDEEIDMIYAQPQTHKGQYARAIEAALKEKNA